MLKLRSAKTFQASQGAQRILVLVLLSAVFSLSGCATTGVPLSDGGLLAKTVGNDVNIQLVSTAAYRRAEADIEKFPKNRNACLPRWKKTNEAGMLAWCESYILTDLLDRYEFLGDTAAANTFLEHTKQIMAGYDRKSRDSQRGSRHTRGWVSKKYSNGKPSYWLVHTGQITRNFARFAAVVHQKKAKRYSADAKRLATTARSFFKSYDVDWDGKRYHHPGNRDTRNPSTTALPLNMQATFGMTAIYLYDYTGDKSFRTRATAIADYTLRFFKISLDFRGTGVVWPYSETEKTEDTSHALLTLRFLHLAMQNNISVSQSQYRTIVKSFISRTSKDNDSMSADVRGKRPGTGPSLAGNCYRMMHIARYNQQLFAICQKVATAQRKQRKSFAVARE